MRRHFRPPSASSVIASIALVAALAGTSYAASQITSKDIKNNSVTGKDIKNDSLSSSDVKNGSLRAKDFKQGDLPATGPQGPTGAAGPAGANAFGSLTYVDGIETKIGPNEEGYAEALCPDGLVPTGGGTVTTALPDDPDGELPYPARDVQINSSYGFISDGVSGWSVYVENTTPQTQYTTANVVCAPAQSVSGNGLRRLKRARGR